jgi:hemin uptake protein HemP
VTEEQNPQEEQQSSRSNSEQPLQPITYTSDELMQGRRELWIEHAGEMYRLRVTALGKLYLTK